MSFALCLFSFASLYAVPPKLPEFPPLKFQPPKPERHVLDNGLVVFLLEDHELPLIKVATYFRLGTQDDPSDQVGLGALLGEGMTRGGSASHTPEDIEATLDRKAASISFGVALESGVGSMSCRAQDFDAIFALFSELLLHPRFRKDQFDLAKAKSLEALRRLNDDPEELARREFRRVMYGSHHPYARIPSPASLDKIKRQDLLEAHRKSVRPNVTWIALSGDFQGAAMLAKLKQAFGAWAPAEVSSPTLTSPTPPSERRVFYVQRSINQSQIRIGDLGLVRHSPDHFAWEVFNELWGGSAASRLFRAVRTQQGLAYAVGSGFSEPAQRGLIVAVSQTRGSQTMAAIQSILKITEEVRDAPFTADEIQWAKEAIRNRFVENFTSSAQIAEQVMGNEFFGFPKNYLETYTARVASVSAEDLRRVGRTYLRPEKSAILVLGDLSTFDKPLSTLGKPVEIKPVDYSPRPDAGRGSQEAP